MRFNKKIWLLLCIGISFKNVYSLHYNYLNRVNIDSSSSKKILIVSAIGFTTTTHLALYQTWYKNYPMGSFHFKNDGKEWLQMDKMGHAYSAYTLGAFAYQSSLDVGYNHKKAALNGLLFGTIFQTPIEILDGFSKNWGASYSDIIANTSGSLLHYLQAYFWEEQHLSLKFSFRNTSIASYRPNTLGGPWYEQVLKDYNGQTYWLSFPLHKIIPQIAKNKTPEWLNLSLGYGAHNMYGGYSNVFETKGIVMDFSHYQRNRQFYFSADIDWIKLLKPKNNLGKYACMALNTIKFPFPSLEWNTQNQFRFNALGF